MVMVIQHFVPFGKAAVLELLHLISMYMHTGSTGLFNPLNAELIPICHLLALLGADHILHVSRIRVNGVLYFNYLYYKVSFCVCVCVFFPF